MVDDVEVVSLFWSAIRGVRSVEKSRLVEIGWLEVVEGVSAGRFWLEVEIRERNLEIVEIVDGEAT